MRRASWLLAALVVPGLGGCSSNLPVQSFVDKLRVLGIQAEPATVAPEQTTTLRTLTVGASAPSYLWLSCHVDPGATSTRPCGFGELSGSALPPACGATQDGTLCTLGTDATTTVTPTSALLSAGELLVTYVTADTGDATRCYLDTLANQGLPTEPDHCVIAYKRVSIGTTINANPTLAALDLTLADGTFEALDGTSTIAIPTKSATLHATRADDASELVDGDYEALSLSWLTNGGAIDGGRSTFDPDGCSSQADCATKMPSTEATTKWKTALPGDVRFWAVLRDDRGGIGWRSGVLTVTVTP
ncbi:MAG: hypothetical protein ABI445_23375 [Polyangia bacterium]